MKTLIKSSILFFLFQITVIIAGYAQNCIPHNIIVMIGDGMGFEQYKASQYFFDRDSIPLYNMFDLKIAAQTGSYGIDYDPGRAWMDKHYLMEAFTESSAAATAISTGYRTWQGMLGLSPDSIPVLNLIELAHRLNKATGVVTTVPFSHATPAGFAIHHPNRKAYTSIAYEMLLNSPVQLIIGAGHPYYDNDGKPRPKPSWTYIDSTLWNFFFVSKKNTISYQGASYAFSKEWLGTDKFTTLDSAISNASKFKKLAYVLPIFESSSYNRSGKSLQPYDIPFPQGVPALDQLSLRALRFLSQDPDGFFLMIESGAIDWAGHDNNLPRLIEETREFQKAVLAVIRWLDSTQAWNNTLLIVMADHETGLLCSNFDQNTGFQPIQPSGYHQLPQAIFLSEDHTNQLIPFLVKGCGWQMFTSFQKHYDPHKGPYVHISNVTHAIQQCWEPLVFVYPVEITTNNNKSVTFFASSPCPDAQFRWYVNNRPIDACKGFSCTISAQKDAHIHCEVTCGSKKLFSNIARIKTK